MEHTVLLLLAVTWGLLQCSDDEGSGRWHHRDLGLSVLYNQLHGDLKTLPVAGSLGNVVTNLLGGLCVEINISKTFMYKLNNVDK